MKHLIVGIDPGKTAGIACLDLDGNVVKISTQRFGGISWFVEVIKNTGSPVIIAGDKKNADETLRKLAAIFDALLFNPQSDITVERKKEASYYYPVANLHERDALSAARAAYNAYANKLKQAERIARERDLSDLDGIKALVIKRHSVYEAMSHKKANRFIRN